MENTNNGVRCNACGCAFVPEVQSQMDGEIEYKYFCCDYCGKAYMVSVTDESLRKDIARYAGLSIRARRKRLSEEELREAMQLKKSNLKRGRELRAMYITEEENGKSDD